MVVVEISQNPNCEPVDLRVFHEVEPPRRVRRVCLEQTPGEPAWYEVTGWTTLGQPCPAVAQRVDDSGEGVALLLHGGDAGLRLRPEDSRTPWDVNDAQQWGVPFLLMADEAGVIAYDEVAHG